MNSTLPSLLVDRNLSFPYGNLMMESIWNVVSEYKPYAISIVALFLVIEQILYLSKKRFVPGPTLVLPFIGCAISLLRNPTKFWDKQSALAKSNPVGISSNYVIGKFIIYIHSTELSQKVLANVRPDAFQLIGYPFGKTMFGDHNLLYMFGQEHKDLRARVAPNFTPRALSAYISIQQGIIVKHLRSWIEAARGKSISLRSLIRDMNLETSQRVFVGPYLAAEAVQRFNADYDLFTVGLLTLPVGFAFRNAKLAVRRLVDTLEQCAEDSKKRMDKGEDPTCLIDFWMQENLTEERAKSSAKYTHKEAGSLLFNFLQAAQDASTSSLLWAIVFLDLNPDVLRRVRLEVLKLWNPEANAVSITAEQLREMRFTEAVAREVLRMRPPAPMLPHSAVRDFALTETYVIPKGTIVFPSLLDSSLQGFPEPNRFDPDRFMEERQEDQVYKRNFLVFGAGAHQCVGQRYAMNHLMLFIALFSTLVDFKRDTTDGCDEMVYAPTIVPNDGCTIFLSQGCTTFPTL